MQIGDLLNKLERVRRSGAGWGASCPAACHGPDLRASLTVGIGVDERILLTCHKGCSFEEILAGIGVTAADIGPTETTHRHRGEWTPHGEAVQVYDYTDENHRRLFQVLRTADKHFSQRQEDPKSKTGWRWNLEGVRRVLYRLPRLIEAVNAGRRVWVVEGEKDVHNLEAHGEVATCNPGGAGKWKPEYTAFFADAAVVVCADKDAPGQAHARSIARQLADVASSVIVVEAAEGKDISDHLSAGLSLNDILTVSPPVDDQADLAVCLHDFIAIPDRYEWIVEGLLEHGDRIIFTGPEGHGKSTFLRQLAVSLAAGIHPFGGFAIQPGRVLLIDCENGPRLVRRRLRELEAVARVHYKRPIPVGGLRIIMRPEGVDLSKSDGSDWLLERVTALKPDVVFVGPLYRLHMANINDETNARCVVGAIDRARVAANCAVIIEAHSGHTEGEHGRVLRPAGASLFMRWPEYGVGLRPDFNSDEIRGHPTEAQVEHWRGGRDDRTWPERLKWGGQGLAWPWVEDAPSGMPAF